MRELQIPQIRTFIEQYGNNGRNLFCNICTGLDKPNVGRDSGDDCNSNT
jgi:hypothetical protein